MRDKRAGEKKIPWVNSTPYPQPLPFLSLLSFLFRILLFWCVSFVVVMVICVCWLSKRPWENLKVSLQSALSIDHAVENLLCAPLPCYLCRVGTDWGCHKSWRLISADLPARNFQAVSSRFPWRVSSTESWISEWFTSQNSLFKFWKGGMSAICKVWRSFWGIMNDEFSTGHHDERGKRSSAAPEC